jgi:nucleoside-diphosphate-sugar epimerase
MDTVLVTGAAGFVGRFTCSELQRQGLQVVGTDRDKAEGVHVCDLTDRESLVALFRSERFDCVIHLAALLPSASAADPFLATKVNVLATAALLEMTIAHGCRRFVFGSSASVYGPAAALEPVSEEVVPSPTDGYGAAKRYVEIVGEKFGASGAIDFAALRIATVVGPGARNTFSTWRSEIFERVGTGVRQSISLPFACDDPLTLVHVEDVAYMLAAMATRHSLRSWCYNTPAELLSARELKRIIEEIDTDVHVCFTGRTRSLAALTDGSRFVREFEFEAPSLRDRLREYVVAQRH